jgi:thiamine pyrophosphate-dependent acetolactate synthase large subunit-like protein
MNGAAALIDVLTGHGIDRLFCSPGSEWPPVWEELARRGGGTEPCPEYLNVRHEETAIAMASGFAKSTGRLPVVLIHTTPGALNAGLGLRAAYHEEIPMLVCCGESIDFGEFPDFDPGGQWVRYLADIGGPARFVEKCVKWSFGVNSRAVLASTVHRACQIAMTPPRGPVFLSLPFEFLHADAAGPIPRSFPKPSALGIPESVESAAMMLAACSRPLIITDTAGRDTAAVAALVELSELIGAPVVEATRQMYLNFPRDHSLHGGFDPNPYLADADLVFLVGAVAPWHPPSAGPKSAKIITLDVNPLRPDLPYWGYQIDLSLMGEISLTLTALLQKLKSRRPPVDAGRLEKLKSENKKRRDAWNKHALDAKNARPIDPHWFCHVLNKTLPEGTIVVEETITHRMPIVRMLDRIAAGHYFGAESGGLGLGMGMALGIKCVHPEAPVVALIGDGSFNYNPVLAALGFVQEYRRPIITIVMNNGGYLSMKRGITSLYPKGSAEKSKTFFGHAIEPNPDYALLAAAFGGDGETVDDPMQIEPALRRAFAAEKAGRSFILDVRLAPDA